MEVLPGCDVFLVLIGRDWSAVTDSMGTRRLDNPDDWVRVEIEAALQRDIRIIPILVDGAVLPQANDLPLSLRPLTRRQARELSHVSFQSDVMYLIADVDTVIKHRQLSRPTVTRIYAPGVDVPALAEALRLWYENQGLEAITVAIPNARMVKCRARQGWKGASRMTALLTVTLQGEGADLLVEIVSAIWVGSAAAAGVGWFVGVALLPPAAPVLPRWPRWPRWLLGWERGDCGSTGYRKRRSAFSARRHQRTCAALRDGTPRRPSVSVQSQPGQCHPGRAVGGCLGRGRWASGARACIRSGAWPLR
jgi:hypothetical protein